MTKRSIDIDAKLLSKAMRLRGGRTKSEVVHPAMKLLVRDLKRIRLAAVAALKF